LVSSAPHVPGKEIKWAWRRYRRQTDQAQRQQVYETLAQAGGHAAESLASALPRPTTEQALSALMDELLQVMSYELEHRHDSEAFDQIVGICRERNEGKRLEELSGFVWRSFTGKAVAAKAFSVWAQRQQAEEALARAAAAAEWVEDAYQNLPIAEAAKRVRAWSDVEDGRVLSGLLRAYELHTDEQIDTSSVVSQELMNQSADAYVAEVDRLGVDRKPARVIYDLGYHFESGGWPSLASLAYEASAERAGGVIDNPRSGNKLTAPLVHQAASLTEQQGAALLWQAVAVQALGDAEEGRELLRELVRNFEDTKAGSIGQLVLAKQLAEAEEG